MVGLADVELAQGLAAGKVEAVDALLESYWERGYRVALGLTGDPAGAEDAIQDAVIAALRRAQTFSPERGSFRAWFFRIIENRVKDQKRAAARRRRHEDVAALSRERGRTDGGLGADEAEIVLDELGGLEPELRAAVTLRYVEGMTYREIGEAMGWPEGTATTRVTRGLKKLRSRLGKRELTPALVAPTGLESLLGGSLGRVPTPPASKDLLAAAGFSAGLTLLSGKAGPSLAAAFTLLLAGLVTVMVWLGGDEPTPPQVADQGAQPTAPSGEPDPSAANTTPQQPDAESSGDQAPTTGEASGGSQGASGHVSVAGSTGVALTVQPAELQGAWLRLSQAYPHNIPSWVGEDDANGRAAYERFDENARREGRVLGRDLGAWVSPRVPDRLYRLPRSGKLSSYLLQSTWHVEPGKVHQLELAPGAYVVALGAREHLNRVETFTVSEGRQTQLELALTPAEVARTTFEFVDSKGQVRDEQVVVESRGAVVDALIEAAPFLRKELSERGFESGPAGVVTLEFAPGTYQFSARRSAGPQRHTPFQEVELRAGENPPIRFELSAQDDEQSSAQTAQLVVHAVDLEGNPVSGAKVHFAYAGSMPVPLIDMVGADPNRDRPVAETDANGRAALPLRPDRPFPPGMWVAVRAGDQAGRAPLATSGTRVVLDQPLGVGQLNVRGRNKQTGQPVGDGYYWTEVSIQSEQRAYTLRCMTSNETPTGARTAYDLPAGTYRVTARASAMTRGRTQLPDLALSSALTVTIEPGKQTELVLDLVERPRVAQPRVLTPEGTDLASSWKPEFVMKVDEGAGAYLATPQPYSVEVWAPGDRGVPGQLPHRFEHVPFDGSAAELHLPEGPVWEVHVIDDEGQPVAGATLELFTYRYGLGHSWHADSKGVIRLRGAFTQRFQVRCGGYFTAWSGAPTSSPVRVSLTKKGERTKPGVVRGRVSDPLGKAVTYQLIAVGAHGSDSARIQNPGGSFELREAPSGDVSIVAFTSAGLQRFELRGVEPGKIREGVNLELQQGGTLLAGRVAGPWNPDLEVVLSSEDPVWAQALRQGSQLGISTRPSSDGTFAFGPLPPGEWVLSVVTDGESLTRSKQVELRVGMDRADVLLGQ